MAIIAKEKEVVIPGEVLAEGLDYLPASGTFREGEKIVSGRLGMVQVDGRLIKLIPLSGKYLPQRGGPIIGKVTNITMNGWVMDINSAYSALLTLKDATSEYISRGADLTKYFNFGDYVVTKIVNVTSQNLVDLTMKAPGLRKLDDGRIIKVSPNKVPRIIGKHGSMVSMIKDYTGCGIIVGQNGIVWVQGSPRSEIVAVDAIRKIESNSHISGLTEQVKGYLERGKDNVQEKG